MSIAKNQSSHASIFSKVRSTKRYYSSKEKFQRFLVKIPLLGRPLRNYLVKYKYALKGVLYHSSFFEDMGYAYLGPVNGHDIARLLNIFEVAKHRGKPCVIHVDTVKGKGYKPAEEDAERFHGIGAFDVSTGVSAEGGENYSSVFGGALCAFAESDKRICAVSAAMPSGTGLTRFAQQYPQRFFDVGIAEQHAVTFCAGLAKNGMVPVFAVYSTFLQRAYDQIIHDVALQKLKVIFGVDRAGFVGADGQTHQGLYDISMMNAVPNLNIFAPSCFADLKNHMYRAVYKETLASAIRYPRGGEGAMPEGYQPDGADYTVFESETPARVLIVSFGRTFCAAYGAQRALAQKGTAVDVLKLNKIKPIHPDAVSYAKGYEKIYFYEEGMKTGGIGEHFLALLNAKGFRGKFSLRAVENTFVKAAEVSEQMKEFMLDTDSIIGDIGSE